MIPIDTFDIINLIKGIKEWTGVDDKKQLGELIKRIRIRNGMTQTEFGALVDDSTKSMVSKWERGETSPNSHRKAILIHLAEKVGINLYPNDEVEGLRNYIEREFYRIYGEFVSKQLEEPNEQFQRAVLALNPEQLREDAIQSAYPTYSEQEVNPDDYKSIVYNYLKLRINGQVEAYPSSDDQIVNRLITEIESLEAKLFLYYFTPDGYKYNMEELSTKQYEQLHNILDFTRFQLKNLSQK